MDTYDYNNGEIEDIFTGILAAISLDRSWKREYTPFHQRQGLMIQKSDITYRHRYAKGHFPSGKCLLCVPPFLRGRFFGERLENEPVPCSGSLQRSPKRQKERKRQQVQWSITAATPGCSFFIEQETSITVILTVMAGGYDRWRTGSSVWASMWVHPRHS